MKNVIKGKLGNFVVDLIFFLVILVIVAVIIFVLRPVQTVANTVVQSGTTDNVIKTAGQHMEDETPAFWDGFFLFLFIALVLSLWVSVFFINTHPVFFIIFAVIIVILTLVSMVFNNVLLDLMRDPGLSGTANSMTVLPFLLQNIVPIFISVAFVTAILLFSKLKLSA